MKFNNFKFYFMQKIFNFHIKLKKIRFRLIFNLEFIKIIIYNLKTDFFRISMKNKKLLKLKKNYFFNFFAEKSLRIFKIQLKIIFLAIKNLVPKILN